MYGNGLQFFYYLSVLRLCYRFCVFEMLLSPIVRIQAWAFCCQRLSRYFQAEAGLRCLGYSFFEVFRGIYGIELQSLVISGVLRLSEAVTVSQAEAGMIGTQGLGLL